MMFMTTTSYNDRSLAEALAVVQKDWRALAALPQELKADRTIVQAAVKQAWQALEYAAEDLKGHPAIVLAALEQNGRALRIVQ
eukprot:3868889-Amphidinium_carterae.1